MRAPTKVVVNPPAFLKRPRVGHGRSFVARLFGVGHPQPLVLEARNIAEYRAGAQVVAEHDAAWIRAAAQGGALPEPLSVRGYCAACGRRTQFSVNSSVSFEWEGLRIPWWTNTLTCPGCHLPARMRAALQLFEERVAPRKTDAIYITEQTTCLYQEFRRRHPAIVGSEYLGNATPRGETNSVGIRCEDLTALTFADASFDHVLSFEVLEHIPDYQAALRECARVLRPNGRLYFSAPFHGAEQHTVRARLTADGTIEHLLPPEYHGDPVNPEGGVLCFRYFGLEVLDELRDAGFSDASAWLYWSAELGYLGEDRVVFVAVR